MSKKHLHRDVIIELLYWAASDREEQKKQGADDMAESFDHLGKAVARLADERDLTRKSAQRMHKKVRALQDELAQARRTIARFEANEAAVVQMLSDQEFDHNRRSNDMILRHATQIVALKGNGSLPKGTITRFEVINDKGRAFTNYRVKDLELSLQDNDRTLKVFLR